MILHSLIFINQEMQFAELTKLNNAFEENLMVSY